MANNRYPQNWKQISKEAKDAAFWRCESCERPHDPDNFFTLTVHHIDRDKQNVDWWNLAVLCKDCHVALHRRENLMTYLDLANEPWFRPHLAGAIAHLVLGRTISRADAMRNHDIYALCLTSSVGGAVAAALRRLELETNGRRDLALARMREAAENLGVIVLESGAF